MYIVECVTEIVFTSKPILAMSAATTCAVLEPGGELSATIVTCGPLYIPFAKPALRISAFAFATFPRKPALGNGSNPSPPACTKPWFLKLGSRKCVAIRPSIAPPRVRRMALRSRTYATACRTWSLSNGGFDVLSAM